MHYLVAIAAAVLFVVSTGLLFNARVRASSALFVIIGIVTLASSYVITKSVLDATFDRRAHHHHVAATAAPQPVATTTDASALDTVLQQIYVGTESALDRILRAGTGQPSASVASDTVVDVVVGLSLAVLGLLAQLFSSLFKRVLGTAE